MEINKDLTKKLSKSKLNVFKTCPKQYWLSQNFPQQAEESYALTRGLELHDIFEKFYQCEDVKNIKNKEEVIEQLSKIENSDKYPEEMKKFANFCEQLNFIIPESCEEKIYDEEKDLVIKWDRIDFDGTNRVIWDYKSGQLKDIESFKFELTFYAMVYMRNTNKKIDFAGIYFIDHGISKMLRITDKLIKYISNDIENYKIEMNDYQLQNEWPVRKGNHCNWCRWRQICDKR